MYRYDPEKDQSEKYGWAKVSDEQPPSDEQQKFWGDVILATVAVMMSAIFFIPSEYIFKFK